MAKIKIVGSTYMLVSDFSMDTYWKVQARRPEALLITEGEGESKQAIFRVQPKCEGLDSFGKYGVAFTTDIPGENARAVITRELPPFAGTEEEVKKYVQHEVGTVAIDLSKVENQIRDALPIIEAEDELIAESIEFVNV